MSNNIQQALKKRSWGFINLRVSLEFIIIRIIPLIKHRTHPSCFSILLECSIFVVGLPHPMIEINFCTLSYILASLEMMSIPMF